MAPIAGAMAADAFARRDLLYDGKRYEAEDSATDVALDLVLEDSKPLSLSTTRPRRVATAGGHDLEIVGWAVDAPYAIAARSVILVLDSRPVSHCAVEGHRPDVAAALKSSAFARSGFTCTLPAVALHHGLHTLSFDVLSARDSFYAVPSLLKILVTT